MSFDRGFAIAIRITGWGLGVFVIVKGRVDGTQTVALILAFIGYEAIARARDRKLPELLERRDREGRR